MTFRLLKPVVPATLGTLFILSGCGGSSSGISVPETIDSGSQNTSEPANIGAALPETTTPAVTPVTETISGRVADGYLRGATVCVDLNENASCDENEPQTVTGEGGLYSLLVNDEYSDKPIVAEVPAEAIDEDTGQPFGRDVIFSTPADRPEFISPLTTLVHQELIDNPALSVDDAEAALEEALGIDSTDDTGLFKDYVALAATGEEETRRKYDYLHQTARVVAGMMGDIRETVKDSVTEQGVDLAGDVEARRALQQMIQIEVRELIPEIAEAVANSMQEIEAVDTSAASTDGTDLTAEFNPEELIASLRPEDIAENASERLEAFKEEHAPTAVPMKDLLADGLYMLDVECDYIDYDYDIYEGDDKVVVEEFKTDGDFTQTIEPAVNVILNDDGQIEFEELPQYCNAYYSKIQSVADSNEISAKHYYYDQSNASWTEETEDESYDPHLFVLIDGEWTAARDGGPETVIEYTEDGSVILATDGGTLEVTASAKQLDTTSVAQHVRNRGAEPQFYKLIDQDTMFPEDSWAYHLFIKRRAHQHMLFNWQSDEDDTNCNQYSDNCNLVDVKDDLGFVPVTTVAELQEQSTAEVTINEAFFDHFEHKPVDLVLSAEPTEDGSLPTEGTARWITAPTYYYIDYQENHYEENYIPDYTDYTCHNPDQELILDDQYPAAIESPAQLPIDAYCPEPDLQVKKESFSESELVLTNTNADGILNDFDALPDVDGNGVPDIPEHKDIVLGESHWKVVEVDGQTMIEIEMPVIVRHRFEQPDVATFLLAEQDGFVRRGMKLADWNIGDEIAYSLPAFETLQPLIEVYVAE